jgi:tetratricopeptide (TPR) repeat protein
VIGAVVVLAGVTAAVLYLHRARYLAMGWFLFLVTLVPVIGIVQFHQVAMADRFAYIPFIGLFVMLVWGLFAVAEKTSVDEVVPALASLCLIVAFAFASSHYLGYWQNEMTLLTQAHNVADRPDALIENSLADGLMAAGRSDEALTHYEQACAVEYGNTLCHYNIARILFDRNEFDKAIEECHVAALLANTRRTSISVGCYLESGAVEMNLGEFDAAEKEFEAALNIDPSDQRALQFREENLRRMKGGSQ